MGFFNSLKEVKEVYDEAKKERSCAICNKMMKKGVLTSDKLLYQSTTGPAFKLIEQYIEVEDAYICRECNEALVNLGLAVQDDRMLEERLAFYRPGFTQECTSYFIENCSTEIKAIVSPLYEKYIERVACYIQEEEAKKEQEEKVEAERTSYQNGSGETIEFLDNKLVIKSVFNKSKTIYYKDITAIEYKNAFKVYIEIKTGNDSTVIYFGSIPKNAELAYDKLLKKWEDSKNHIEKDPTQIINNVQPSISDEIIKLKKLLDEGIITHEEFVALKKKLLS